MKFLTSCSFFLALSAAYPSQNHSPERESDLHPRYTLPTDTFPTSYDVQLFINPNSNEYSGIVALRIIPNVNIQSVYLHSKNLNISEVNIQSDRVVQNLFLNYSLVDDTEDVWVFNTIEVMSAFMAYTVTISYTGEFVEDMKGLFVGSYGGNSLLNNYVVTNLPATNARRVFPCYDEPTHKAIFRTTVYAPPLYDTVASNMPERDDTNKPEVAGYVKHEFEDTPAMSTHQFSVLVSNFDSVTSLGSTPVTIYSRSNSQWMAEQTLPLIQSSLTALEDYLGYSAALPKLDRVALIEIPASVANWGLSVHRESNLLIDNDVMTSKQIQDILVEVSKDNVYQLLGNEVSPSSWSSAWVNEGLANLIGYHASDLAQDDWKTGDQFTVDILHKAFQSDSYLSYPALNDDVLTDEQIERRLNSKTSRKAAGLIRMMEHLIGQEVFKRGLLIYLQSYSRQSASPSQLYSAMQQALTESNMTIPYSLTTVMTRWTDLAGHPVVTVRRTAPSSNSFSVNQVRFLKSGVSSNRWHVPINVVLSTNPDFSDTTPQFWLTLGLAAQAIAFEDLSQAEWFIVNKQQTGYYRVNYDNQNWHDITNVLKNTHQQIHVLNRAQLLDDVFNLAGIGMTVYSNAFELAEYLVEEKEYAPWMAASNAFKNLKVHLHGQDAYEDLKIYVLSITAPLYVNLGFNTQNNEDHTTKLLRSIILDINCRFGNEDCLQTTQDMFLEIKNNGVTTVDKDLRYVVFCNGVQQGDESDFEALWDKLLLSTNGAERLTMMQGLACTNNPDLSNRLLTQVIDNTSSLTANEKVDLLLSLIDSHPANTELALEFFVENYIAIQEHLSPVGGVDDVFETFIPLLTENHLELVNSLSAQHGNSFTEEEQQVVATMQEQISSANLWKEQNLQLVHTWLSENYKNAATSLTSSAFVLVLLTLINLLLFSLL